MHFLKANEWACQVYAIHPINFSDAEITQSPIEHRNKCKMQENASKQKTNIFYCVLFDVMLRKKNGENHKNNLVFDFIFKFFFNIFAAK